MPFPGITTPDLGPRPSLEWVAPTSLLVDGTYQRSLSKRSIQLITKMIKEFAWSRMKPPIVVRIKDKLHVIDGQHTAIVAATLRIDAIPVFIVRAEKLDDRARAFVGHNTDRITVAPIDIYRALLASGDQDALECDAVLKRAGVTLKIINQTSALNVGDTMAVGTVRSLVKRRGPMQARRILTVLIAAKKAPIAAHEITAVEYIVCTYPKAVSHELLAIVIRGDTEGFIRAAAQAKLRKISMWKALADRWIKVLEDESAVARTA